MHRKEIDPEKERIADGFGPPKAYLNAFEAGLFEQLDIEEEFGTTEDGFAPSPAYLDTLESTVIQAYTEDGRQNDAGPIPLEKRRKRVVPLWWYASGIAAGLLFFMMLWKPYDQKDATIDFASLGQAETSYYLQQEQYFFTDSDLEILLSDSVYDMEIEDELIQEGLYDYLLDIEVDATQNLTP